MNITLIHGTARKGSTWHCADLLLGEIGRLVAVEKTEITLPAALPEFCVGCFSCFKNGEATCPHARYTLPIKQALLGCDLLILTSPVYAFDISGQLKTLLDHFSFMWMSHRPEPDMFCKTGLIVSTTAGAGLKTASKTVHNSMKFWGIGRIFRFCHPSGAMRWEEVTEKKRRHLEKQAVVLARSLVRFMRRQHRLQPRLFQRFFLTLMRFMMKANTWNLHDRDYWEAHNWFSGKSSPF